MTAPMATAWQEIADLTGPQGEQGIPGDDGVSITGAEVNGSGDLIVDLSSGAQVNAGHVVGANGTSVNFENSVPDVASLPTSPPLLSAYYVAADGHLYVFEGAGAANDGKAGYTDVGAIKGDTGATGATGTPGTDGVSVTGAAINGSGHLILTLSVGGPIDAGVAKGADGAPGTPGADGTDGADGADGLSPITYTAGAVPAATGYRVGQIAFGSDGKMLRAV